MTKDLELKINKLITLIHNLKKILIPKVEEGMLVGGGFRRFFLTINGFNFRFDEWGLTNIKYNNRGYNILLNINDSCPTIYKQCDEIELIMYEYTYDEVYEDLLLYYEGLVLDIC
jgi:hypothetical protein